MSSRAFGLLLLAAAVSQPGAASAQTDGSRERYVARLRALQSEATRALARSDSTRWEHLDTIRAGGLTVLARSTEASLVRRAAPLAWSSLDSLYGDAASRLLTQPLLFWVMTRPIRYRPPGTARLQGVMAAETATDDDVKRQLIRGAAVAIQAQTDTAFVNWLGVLLVPVVEDEAERARVYVELLTAPSAAVRRCYAGDLGSCSASLNLFEGEDRTAIWYDPAEQRSLVRNARPRADTDACLIARSDAACLAVLHATGVEPPLTSQSRHVLVRLALIEGGREAYVRLARSAGRPLGERLALAAGVPSDSLMRQWRTAVLSARPKPVTFTPSVGWVALGWATLFSLLALRSTRWR
jgi:hypothetical protein